MRPLIAGLALLLFIGLPLGPAVVSAQEQEEEQESVPLCSDCHDQAAGFAANPHARGKAVKSEVPNAVCESCHGDGTAHIEAGGDKDLIRVLAGRSGADVCLGCHDQSGEGKARRNSIHANSETVNCLTCHSIHTPEALSPHLLAKKELTLCSSCHGSQAASFRNKPYAHRIGRGGMECSSCHDPHGRSGEDVLRPTRAGDPACLGCHTEKRGPFVFQHGAVAAGDCLSCHESHGSSNPKRLSRATVHQLCTECHSPISGGTLGSQPPSFHNLSLARYRNCTTCHVAVHGSNRSPQLLK
ncbi:MAG TPA: DmsE family decaheme c-type cytochrome [Thermoanaerobaculia bacterium]|nr:DmsE family decaheme c-type cytochrome [Thermoanaerobaculia bacterium]